MRGRATRRFIAALPRAAPPPDEGLDTELLLALAGRLLALTLTLTLTLTLALTLALTLTLTLTLTLWLTYPPPS